MCKKIHKFITMIIVLTILGIISLYTNGNIGVPKSRIESDARQSQKIDDSWEVAKSISNSLCAMVFYNEQCNDHTFSIYINRKGFSFGYIFRSGGSLSSIEESIYEFKLNGYGKALLSMNKVKAERIEIDNGQEIRKIDIDSEKPFTIILEENIGVVTIYDIHDKVINYRF